MGGIPEVTVTLIQGIRSARQKPDFLRRRSARGNYDSSVPLQELFAYNYRARDRQLQAVRHLSQEQFQRPIGSSFPSLRDTLAHLVGGGWVWL